MSFASPSSFYLTENLQVSYPSLEQIRSSLLILHIPPGGSFILVYFVTNRTRFTRRHSSMSNLLLGVFLLFGFTSSSSAPCSLCIPTVAAARVPFNRQDRWDNPLVGPKVNPSTSWVAESQLDPDTMPGFYQTNWHMRHRRATTSLSGTTSSESESEPLLSSDSLSASVSVPGSSSSSFAASLVSLSF